MRVERKISGGGGTVNHLGQPVSLNYDDHYSATFDHGGAASSPTNERSSMAFRDLQSDAMYRGY